MPSLFIWTYRFLKRIKANSKLALKQKSAAEKFYSKIDKRINIVIAISIISLAASFIVFGYFDFETERMIHDFSLDDFKIHQLHTTEILSSKISADLELIVKELNQITTQEQVKDGKFISNESLSKIQTVYSNIKEQAEEIDSIALFDKDGVVLFAWGSEGINQDIIGVDLSFRDYVKQTQATQKPYFSNGFAAIQSGNYKIMITNPIFDNNGEYSGLATALLPSESFFNHYDELPESRHSLTVIGKDQNIIVHPNDGFVGKSVYGDLLAEFIQEDPEVYSFGEKVLNENSVEQYVFQTTEGEYVSTGAPVMVNGQAQYHIFTLTPTELIFANTENLLGNQRIVSWALLAGISITLIVFVMTISRLKNLEVEKKLERFSTVGELASRIAHDLRTPLFVLRSTVDLLFLRSKDKLDYRDKEDFESIQKSVEKMENMIETVLNYVRIRPLQVQPTSTSALINNSINSLHLPKNITIQKPQNDFVLVCDAKQIEVVCTNLLNNSIQAMPQGGKITVLASKEGENIVLEFLDEGPGIPKNLHESIFEPLYTTKPTGTGLGLVSCKNIVKQHGGSISVSNNPTNFTIKIPSNQKHAELVPDIMRK